MVAAVVPMLMLKFHSELHHKQDASEALILPRSLGDA